MQERLGIPPVASPLWSYQAAKPRDLIYAAEAEILKNYGKHIKEVVTSCAAPEAMLATQQVMDFTRFLKWGDQTPNPTYQALRVDEENFERRVSFITLWHWDFKVDFRCGFPADSIWLVNDFVNIPIRVLPPEVTSPIFRLERISRA